MTIHGLAKQKMLVLLITVVMLLAGAKVSQAEIREASKDTDTGLFGLPLIPKDSIFENCYAGFGTGMMSSNSPRTNDDGSLGGNYSSDNSGWVGDVFFGYQFTEHLGVEAGYHYLGKSEFAGNSSGGPSWSAGAVTAEHEAEGGSFAAVVRYPLNDRLYLIGSAGMFWWISTERFEENGVQSTEKESGSTWTFSGGLEYDVGVKDRFVWRTEVRQFSVDDSSYDITQGTFGIVYRFP
ncbi:MAG: outer membrane beta-barrel protein [Candidatus Omnitrophica bacterium]|nr:outer membrane beta-barrel protein [Candidatus Omnitrophota bacterium]